jgi:hypothetical protein
MDREAEREAHNGAESDKRKAIDPVAEDSKILT